jgi:hypothetical protein
VGRENTLQWMRVIYVLNLFFNNIKYDELVVRNIHISKKVIDFTFVIFPGQFWYDFLRYLIVWYSILFNKTAFNEIILGWGQDLKNETKRNEKKNVF